VIRPAHAVLAVAFLAAACASTPEPALSPETVTALAAAGPDPTPFSAAPPGAALPLGWRPYRLNRFVKATQYRLVPLEGTIAMQAIADASASGLRYDTLVDPHEYPWLTWMWKVPALNDKADNTIARVEDSPARIVLFFEGGRDNLPASEQINYDLAKAIAGNELPYATLMYIWENRLPIGAVITHHFTTRIKMIVAGSGHEDLGVWHEERVNVLEDYRRAFGEEPPRIKSVGIMSDSDNTGARTIAYYGDLRFRRQ
jgi:hypothetical protein